MGNEYTKLARSTIEAYLKDGQIIDIPKKLSSDMLKEKAGVFVSIHKKEPMPGEEDLRGCIGTFLPTKINIAEEIVENAIAAATRDYRFEPINQDELPELEISVDVLGKPELLIHKPINQLTNELINKLDSEKYGVIVKAPDGRTGLLLPDIEGVETPEKQIFIARQKAGILPDEPILISRFEVKRYKE